MSDDAKELLQFLREENEANRRAVRDDAEANRKLLLDTVKIVSVPVGILILIAGWMGFRSIGDLKSTLESEAQQSTQAEIARMQTEIRTRLSEQFQTPALQQAVKDAAVEATKTAADPLIKSEVASQVKARIDAERPTIEAAVTQQTRTALSPIIQRVKDEADLQVLITRMNADDALAFDSLMKMSTSGDPSQRAMIVSALRTVFSAHNSGMFTMRSFNSPQTDEQLMAHLSDADAWSREAAVDALQSKRNPALLPKLVEMMRSDPSINVRCAAYRVFDEQTVQAFQCLDPTDAALAWWQNNKQKFTSTQ